MRRAARLDANQPAIVAALESVGCTVRSLAALGKDCEDLLVGFRGANYLMEIKNPESSGKHRGASKISDGQRKQQAEWKGQTAIVWTIEEALAVVGLPVPKKHVPFSHEKTDRNAALVAGREAGVTFSALAKTHQISIGRARQIFENEQSYRRHHTTLDMQSLKTGMVLVVDAILAAPVAYRTLYEQAY